MVWSPLADLPSVTYHSGQDPASDDPLPHLIRKVLMGVVSSPNGFSLLSATARYFEHDGRVLELDGTVL